VANFLKKFLSIWLTPENREMIGVVKQAIDLIEANPNLGSPVIGKEYWLYEDPKKRFWIVYYYISEGGVKFARLSFRGKR